jgi:hypothetical protein
MPEIAVSREADVLGYYWNGPYFKARVKGMGMRRRRLRRAHLGPAGSSTRTSSAVDMPRAGRLGWQPAPVRCGWAAPVARLDSRPDSQETSGWTCSPARGSAISRSPPSTLTGSAMFDSVRPGDEYPVFDCDFGRIGVCSAAPFRPGLKSRSRSAGNRCRAPKVVQTSRHPICPGEVRCL